MLSLLMALPLLAVVALVFRRWQLCARFSYIAGGGGRSGAQSTLLQHLRMPLYARRPLRWLVVAVLCVVALLLTWLLAVCAQPPPPYAVRGKYGICTVVYELGWYDQRWSKALRSALLYRVVEEDPNDMLSEMRRRLPPHDCTRKPERHAFTAAGADDAVAPPLRMTRLSRPATATVRAVSPATVRAPERPYLLFSAVGLEHKLALWNASPCQRRFDIVLYSYVPQSPPQPPVDYFHVEKGLKLELFARYADRHDISRYQAVWLVDEDIESTTENINLMFEIFTAFNLSMGMPALGGNSAVHHRLHRWVPDQILHYVNFVECGLPIFNRQHLRTVLPSLASAGSGHSVDYLWTLMLNPNTSAITAQIGVIDATPVQHPTRLSTVEVEVSMLEQERHGLAQLIRAGVLPEGTEQWQEPFPRLTFSTHPRALWLLARWLPVDLLGNMLSPAVSKALQQLGLPLLQVRPDNLGAFLPRSDWDVSAPRQLVARYGGLALFVHEDFDNEQQRAHQRILLLDSAYGTGLLNDSVLGARAEATVRASLSALEDIFVQKQVTPTVLNEEWGARWWDMILGLLGLSPFCQELPTALMCG